MPRVSAAMRAAGLEIVECQRVLAKGGLKHALVIVTGLGLAMQTAQAAAQAAVQPVRIELTQTPCQFLESEGGKDRGFKSAKAADCNEINSRTGTQRLAQSKPIELKPGKYVFRVKNKDVPYELGFWLRGDSLVDRARLPSVSGGGLTAGKTQDYSIELRPGNYVYSCPLNPTPDYKLVVRN
jgi:hypothetical protein